ncbi:von Willebrand factor A domain-containing protein 8-like [Carassius gibelio]|uniref:von Willebrand factor A domain-containing protein 8-like n=1 Tax=Carassius gibelio TaxID=101364 RepID=UPI0022791A96|nr:von Willebrand factor A domain-containing protein 8-like [Carassius gibelio]
MLRDTNLERYRISLDRFACTLTSNPQVNAFAVFICSLGDQADRLQRTLPAGRSFVTMDTKQIPQILQQIFTSTMLSSARENCSWANHTEIDMSLMTVISASRSNRKSGLHFTGKTKERLKRNYT